MRRVLLIIKLRWMLFKNSLRSKSGCAELLSAILLGLVLVPMDLVLSAVLVVTAFRLHGTVLFVPATSCILAGVTVVWQLIPLLTSSLGSDTDIERFRQYPLSISELFVVDVTLGIFDPVALLAYPAILAVLAGCVARSPADLPVSLVSIGLFTAFNVILSRYMHRLISALLSNRRRREIIAVVIVLLLLAPQIILSMGQRARNKSLAAHNSNPGEAVDYTRRTIVTAGEYVAWLPPGLAARNLSGGAEGGGSISWLAFLALAGFVFAIAWIEHNTLIRQYYGRGSSALRSPKKRDTSYANDAQRAVLMELPSGSRIKRAGRAVSFLALMESILPWLPKESAAILDKEIKYLYRSPRAFLMFIGPVLGTIIFMMPRGLTSITARVEEYRLAIIILYSILLDTQFFCNAFGFDLHGAKLYFMAPLRGRSVLIGKNLAAIMIIGIQVAAITIIFSLFTGAVGPASLIHALFAVAIAAPLSLALGNYLSVLYPRGVDSSKVSGRSYSHVSQFAILLELPLVAIIFGAGPVVGLILDSSWVTYAVFCAEAAAAFVVYWMTLGRAGVLLETRSESFLQSLVARK